MPFPSLDGFENVAEEPKANPAATAKSVTGGDGPTRGES